MAGREDFGILRLAALVDDRFHDAAESLPRVRGLRLYTICGVVAALGGYLARETDDGVLRGDGVRMTRSALNVSTKAAFALLECMKRAQLVREVDGGLYLCGFRDAYSRVIETRRRDRERKRVARALSGGRPEDTKGACPADVRRMSSGSDPIRSDPIPTPTEPDRTEGGGGQLEDASTAEVLQHVLAWTGHLEPCQTAVDRMLDAGMTAGGIRTLLFSADGQYRGSTPLDFAATILRKRSRENEGGYYAKPQAIQPAEPKTISQLAADFGLPIREYVGLHSIPPDHWDDETRKAMETHQNGGGA